MDGLLNYLIQAESPRLWVAVLATAVLIVMLAVKAFKAAARRWRPVRAPLEQPRGRDFLRAGADGQRRMLDEMELISGLAARRSPGMDYKTREVFRQIFMGLYLTDATRTAADLVIAGSYREALDEIARLTRGAEKSWRPPPPNKVHWQRVGEVAMSPFNLYLAAGAVAYCLSDEEAAAHFEKARARSSNDTRVLRVLDHIYSDAAADARRAPVVRELIAALERDAATLREELKTMPAGPPSMDADTELRGIAAELEQRRAWLASNAAAPDTGPSL